jgi:uncharacterized membrane protein
MTHLRSRLPSILRREWSLIAAVVFGAALRSYQLSIQIPLDDEWHALHSVALYDYGHLLTHFGWTNHSLPLTLYDRLVADTFGLSEFWLRLPVFAAGVASILVLPLLVRPWAGAATADVFAWLLAVSPHHVYMSRYARPYSLALLLSLTAAAALPLAARLPRFVWVSAVAASLAPYFHLSTLAPVLAVAAFPLWRASPVPRTTARAVAVRLTLGLVVLLGPPLLYSHEQLGHLLEWEQPGLATLNGAWQLAIGGPRFLAWGMLSLAGVGLIVVRREQRSLTGYFAFVGLSAVAAAFLVHPVGIASPGVFLRYCAVTFTLGLLAVAVGIVAVVRRSHPWLSTLAGPAAALLWLGFGPWPRTQWSPNAWTNHPAVQGVFAHDVCAGGRAPRFYEILREDRPPGSERLVEAPWFLSGALVPFHCYQKVHRQDMLIGFIGEDARGIAGLPRAGELPLLSTRPPRFRFRSFVYVGDHEELARRGVTMVAFHHRLVDEVFLPPSLEDLRRHAEQATADDSVTVQAWIRRYRHRYGPPVFDDATLTVFRIAESR